MKEINTDEFEAEVIRSKSDVLVAFTAPWCGFCKNTEKMLSATEQELADVKFCKLDIEQNSEIAKKYNVRGVPTTLFFKEGTMKNRRTGALTKAEVYALAERKPLKTTQV